ncbi:hypothetical protein L3Q82_016292, partial [Scortum barcoo]
EYQGPLRRPDWRYRGPPWSQAWGWGSGGPGGFARDRPGSARNGDVARLPVGSPPAGRSMRGRWNVVWVAVVAGASTTQSLDQNSGNRAWNVTSLGGKEPELVRELRGTGEIVGSPPRIAWALEPSSPEKGWTLHYWSCQGGGGPELVWACLAPQLSRHVLEFTRDRRSLPSLRLGIGLAVVLCLRERTASQFVHNFIFRIRGCPSVHVAPGHPRPGSMIDFVVVSSDLRPSSGHSGKERLSCQPITTLLSWLHGRGGSWTDLADQTYCGVCWERLAEPSVRSLQLHLRKSFSQIPREAGDIESRTMFSAHCRRDVKVVAQVSGACGQSRRW